EILERERSVAIDEAVIDQPRHRQNDQDAKERREQNQNRPRQIELAGRPQTLGGERDRHRPPLMSKMRRTITSFRRSRLLSCGAQTCQTKYAKHDMPVTTSSIHIVGR